jgi:hypothetical protein
MFESDEAQFDSMKAAVDGLLEEKWKQLKVRLNELPSNEVSGTNSTDETDSADARVALLLEHLEGHFDSILEAYEEVFRRYKVKHVSLRMANLIRQHVKTLRGENITAFQDALFHSLRELRKPFAGRYRKASKSIRDTVASLEITNEGKLEFLLMPLAVKPSRIKALHKEVASLEPSKSPQPSARRFSHPLVVSIVSGLVLAIVGLGVYWYQKQLDRGEAQLARRAAARDEIAKELAPQLDTCVSGLIKAFSDLTFATELPISDTGLPTCLPAISQRQLRFDRIEVAYDAALAKAYFDFASSVERLFDVKALTPEWKVYLDKLILSGMHVQTYLVAYQER